MPDTPSEALKAVLPRGRPINSNSARQQQPWKKYGISKASFYWKKRYGDLPEMTKVNRARKLSPWWAWRLKRDALNMLKADFIEWVEAMSPITNGEALYYNILNEKSWRHIDPFGPSPNESR